MCICNIYPLSIVFSHLLVGFYFAFYGFWNLYHWRPIVQDMAAKNIPLPFLILSCGIFWQTVAGVMIMYGLYVKLAALVLIPFTIISVFLFHPYWKHQGEQRALNLNIFIANLTVSLSALLLLLNNITPVSHWQDLLF